ncbi:MAG TPA: PQQ-binding-like beta-propeller repeat protein [Rhizomicrobium sp.]
MILRAWGLVAVLTAIVAVSSADRAQAQSAWPQIGYNPEHTGYNPQEVILTKANVPNLVTSGLFATGGQIIDQPVVADGVAYVNSTDGNLYAFDLAAKKIKWQFYSYGNMDAPTGVILWSNKAVLVTCEIDTKHWGLCSLDPATGKLQWSFADLDPNQQVAPGAPPVIAGNVVYYREDRTYGYWLYALNAKTGAILWTFGQCQDDGVCIHLGSSPPALLNGMVYLGCSGGDSFEITVSGGVCAINASNGQLVWQRLTPGDYSGRLVAAGGYVYVSTTNGTCCDPHPTVVTAINGAHGGVLWSETVTDPGTSPTGPPAFKSGKLYVPVNGNPGLIALNATTGKQLWAVPANVHSQQTPTVAGPDASGGVIFLGCSPSNAICAFNAGTGETLWQSSYNRRGDSPAPAVTNGTVYGVCNFNNLCLWTPKTK